MGESEAGPSNAAARPNETPWWKPWMVPSVILSVLGSLITAVALLGYMVFYRMPDLEKQLERTRTENADHTATWEKTQQERFTKIELQLVNVRTNLLRLCVRGKQPDKDCQLKER